MNYERLWLLLHAELSELRQKGVTAIHPSMLKAFMSYMEEREDLKSQFEKEEVNSNEQDDKGD